MAPPSENGMADYLSPGLKQVYKPVGLLAADETASISDRIAALFARIEQVAAAGDCFSARLAGLRSPSHSIRS